MSAAAVLTRGLLGNGRMVQQTLPTIFDILQGERHGELRTFVHAFQIA